MTTLNRNVAVTAAIALAVGFGTAVVARAAMDQDRAAPTPLRDGTPSDTMARAKKLVVELRKFNWDSTKVDRALLRVPDQSLSKTPDRDTFAIRLPKDVYKEVALYTDLYLQTQKHLDSSKIEGVDVQTQGFWIVGWKDGRITKVPYNQTRVFDKRLSDGHVVGYPVFPGMSVYQGALVPGTRNKSDN